MAASPQIRRTEPDKNLFALQTPLIVEIVDQDAILAGLEYDDLAWSASPLATDLGRMKPWVAGAVLFNSTSLTAYAVTQTCRVVSCMLCIYVSGCWDMPGRIFSSLFSSLRSL